jgi:Flp pilus assembly protein TadG
MRLNRSRHPRRGVAAVEMAVITPFLLGLIVGIWEIGQLIQTQTILNNAARNGARLASQGQVINLVGAYTEIYTNTGTPNVTSTVLQYLQSSGITNLNGVTVQFQYLSGNTGLTDPYQGSQNQQFMVSVTMPYSNVKISPLSLVNPQTMGAQAVWQIMVDTPLTINPNIPLWSPSN